MNYNANQAAGILGAPNNYSANSQASTTPAPSPVMVAQKQLDDATNGLHMTITALLDRLQPVLGPSQPGNESASNPPASSVAARIAQSASAVSGAVSRLGDIINRLEV